MKDRPPVCRSAVLMSVVLLIIWSGCSYGRRAKVVDLTPGRRDSSVVVPTIDGRITADDEWTRCVSAPFEKRGTIRFTWDEEAIYGLLKQHERRGAWQPDERLCVSLRADQTVVRLEFDERLGAQRSGLELLLSQVRQGGEWAAPAALPEDALEWVSNTPIACSGFYWSVEFRLLWSALGVSDPSAAPVWIHVYRIRPERPEHVFRLTPEPEH